MSTPNFALTERELATWHLAFRSSLSKIFFTLGTSPHVLRSLHRIKALSFHSDTNDPRLQVKDLKKHCFNK